MKPTGPDSDGTATPATPVPDETPETAAASLDNIMSEMIGLSADDCESLQDIQRRLQALAESEDLLEHLREEIRFADAFVEQAVEGATGNPDAALTTAVDTLAEVAKALDDTFDTHAATDAEPTDQATEGTTEETTAGPTVEPPAAPAAPAPAAAAADSPLAGLSTTLSTEIDMDILREYIVESIDHVAAAEVALLELESNPEDTEQINTVFRAFHTIKGTSGFFELALHQKLAHLAENLLDRARDGQVRILGGYADLCLRSCDVLKALIEGVDGLSGGDPMPVPEELEALLIVLADPAAAGISEEAETESLRVGDILVGRGVVDRNDIETAAELQGPMAIGETLVQNNIAPAEEVAKAIRTQKQINSTSTTSEATVRVGTNRLDTLINMVGELVIAQSMVSQDPSVTNDEGSRLGRNVSHASKIIRELQDLTMSLRMVPLKGVFQKMNRLVRDLGRKSGKTVKLVTEGEETEIDRTMVEALNDPLLHMIRNSVDHGVESADVRTAAGKNPTGTVRLRAYHSAGNVVIELIDDGKGIDRERVMAKAIERGLVDAGRELTDSEVFNLIFQPGFSTAAKITDVSGRGVGMDVVKRGIDALRGRIEVTSTPGVGSTFSMRLPLTMAIADGMLVRVGDERYILPTVSIEQSFRPKAGAISTVVGAGEVVMLRGDLLPVFRLGALYDVTDAVTDPGDALLIVIESQGKRCALMVDELLGQQQVVIKTLGESFGNIPGVSGAAILGDGNVGLILDAGGLLNLACRDGETEALEAIGATS